jgi:hypothetical protein
VYDRAHNVSFNLGRNQPLGWRSLDKIPKGRCGLDAMIVSGDVADTADVSSLEFLCAPFAR